MSLYLKHRPQTFSEVVGNQETVDSIKNMLQKKNHPHTYLLSGGTGCGKTTIARIMTKELGITGMDLKEINSADFRGIDSVREIIKNSQLHPIQSPARAWIIDEAHKLTNDAQNAFLKILEDTPDHVYFIICTTEPNKLLPTIRNRCSMFQVQKLTEKEMFRLIRKVLRVENETLEKEIIEQISESSEGHPRAGLQTLEQVLNVEPELRMEIAKKRIEEQGEMIELARALVSGKGWKTVADILLKLKGQDAEGIRRVVLGYCQATLLNGKSDERIGLIMEEFLEPTYNSGFPQIVYACFSCCQA